MFDLIIFIIIYYLITNFIKLFLLNFFNFKSIILIMFLIVFIL